MPGGSSGLHIMQKRQWKIAGSILYGILLLILTLSFLLVRLPHPDGGFIEQHMLISASDVLASSIKQYSLCFVKPLSQQEDGEITPGDLITYPLYTSSGNYRALGIVKEKTEKELVIEGGTKDEPSISKVKLYKVEGKIVLVLSFMAPVIRLCISKYALWIILLLWIPPVMMESAARKRKIKRKKAAQKIKTLKDLENEELHG